MKNWQFTAGIFVCSILLFWYLFNRSPRTISFSIHSEITQPLGETKLLASFSQLASSSQQASSEGERAFSNLLSQLRAVPGVSVSHSGSQTTQSGVLYQYSTALSIAISDLTVVPEVLSILKNNFSTVVQTSYSPKDLEKSRLALYKSAEPKAKEKADQISSSFGLRRGQLLQLLEVPSKNPDDQSLEITQMEDSVAGVILGKDFTVTYSIW